MGQVPDSYNIVSIYTQSDVKPNSLYMDEREEVKCIHVQYLHKKIYIYMYVYVSKFKSSMCKVISTNISADPTQIT